MTKTHVIHWRSRANGRSGIGAKFFDRAEAEKLAAELNEDFPEIEHIAFNTQSETAEEPSVVIALPESRLA
jgi:hypothetical protein